MMRTFLRGHFVSLLFATTLGLTYLGWELYIPTLVVFAFALFLVILVVYLKAIIQLKKVLLHLEVLLISTINIVLILTAICMMYLTFTEDVIYLVFVVVLAVASIMLSVLYNEHLKKVILKG